METRAAAVCASSPVAVEWLPDRRCPGIDGNRWNIERLGGVRVESDRQRAHRERRGDGSNFHAHLKPAPFVACRVSHVGLFGNRRENSAVVDAARAQFVLQQLQCRLFRIAARCRRVILARFGQHAFLFGPLSRISWFSGR